jgi:hypothetical protein
MYDAAQKAFSSRSFTLRQGGQRIGSVHFNAWSEKGTIELAWRSYPVQKEAGSIGSPFFVETDKGRIDATPRGVGFVITSPSGAFSLQRAGSFPANFVLAANKTPLGTIRIGWFRRRTTIDLSDVVPPVLQIFAFFLAMTSLRGGYTPSALPT